MRLKVMRDKVAWFIASKEGKKNLTEGVTDDNFYDYGAYVNLIAKSLRRIASDRQAYTVMNWRMPENWGHLPREDMDAYSEKETGLLNKWADILEIDEDSLYELPRFDPYFDALHDYLFGSKQPLGEAMDALGKEFDDWENSIQNLKADILSELGANYFYMWD